MSHHPIITADIKEVMPWEQFDAEAYFKDPENYNVRFTKHEVPILGLYKRNNLTGEYINHACAIMCEDARSVVTWHGLNGIALKGKYKKSTDFDILMQQVIPSTSQYKNKFIVVNTRYVFEHKDDAVDELHKLSGEEDNDYMIIHTV